MGQPRIGARTIWCAVSTLCASLALGCGSSHAGPGELDGALADGSVAEDASTPAPSDASIDAAPVVPIDAGFDAALDPDAGPPIGPVDAGPPDPVDPDPGVDPRFEVEMNFVTANIGRSYDTRAQVAAVFDHVGDVIGARSGPRLIGWQEIGEGDPCGGSCEWDELRARFTAGGSWENLRPSGTRPSGGSERVKVPVTSKGAGGATSVRAVFASPGWAGVSPTRFVTVAHYADRNLSFINTHFIAGAWSCSSNVAQRRDYWRQAWATLREQVAREHDRGRNVVVTGDLNRPRGANDCTPAWDPTSLHPRARVIGGAGIDYVFAVPAAGWSFTLARRGDGTVERGTIHLGIDGHQSHWVAGRFEHP